MSTRRGKQRDKSPQMRIEHVLVQRPPALIEPSVVPGRLLVAWMSDDQVSGYGALPGNEQQAIVSRAAEARAAVATRAPGVDQAEALLPPPRELDNYCQVFLASPLGQAFTKAGYSIALVNLGILVGFQGHVRLPSCRQLVSQVGPRDPVSIARRTLPYQGTNKFDLAYNGAKATWLVGTDDPNLRIAGPVGPEGGEGGVSIGFRLEAPVSVMRVQRYGGRLFLSDGYHRAVGLLLRGVRFAPALVRDARAFEDLGAMAHLPIGAFTGDRPPLVTDFLDDDVSMQAQVPGSARRLLIHAMLLP